MSDPDTFQILNISDLEVDIYILEMLNIGT